MNLSSIFLGGVPSEQRKYLRVLLEHLIRKGVRKIHIPCTGRFTIVKTAIEAGFERENIYSSDISLFSSLLGYLYAGKKIEDLPFSLVEDEHREVYYKLETDVEKVAYIMVLMKICQLRPEVYYERTFIEELESNIEKYTKQMVETLEKSIEQFKGIHYDILDVRQYFSDEVYDKDTVIIMNPPAFAKGYEKMFNFGKYIKYLVPVAEFNFDKEYQGIYEFSRNCVSPYIWYTSKEAMVRTLPAEEIIYAKENSIEKYSYILTPHLHFLEDFDLKYYVEYKKGVGEIPQYQLYPKDRDLTLDDKISIKSISKETALYYRDLFAHRLGSTVAELYFGIFVNGDLLSVSGFNTSFLRRLQENYIFENFCFSTSHDKYENLNRLGMMCLVSGQFKNYLITDALKNSSYVDLKTFKTVCLTKYRKSKLNNRLLTLTHSERVESNGTYKLTYEQEFYMDRTYQRCLELFLSDDVRIKKSWLEANNLTEDDVQVGKNVRKPDVVKDKKAK